MIGSRQPERRLVDAVDKFFVHDGELTKILDERIISYTIRRIIHGIRFMLEESNTSHTDLDKTIDHIKTYFNENTALDFEDPALERLTPLIYSILVTAEKRNTKRMQAVILDRCKEDNMLACYICGVSLDFDDPESDVRPEIEHLFPHSFGGENSLSNFRLACSKCNAQKSDAIGAFDFHFERISTRHTESHEKYASRLFARPNAVALKLKANCRCTHCGRSADEVGELKAFRLEENDSWHYLNIGMTCNNHNDT